KRQPPSRPRPSLESRYTPHGNTQRRASSRIAVETSSPAPPAAPTLASKRFVLSLEDLADPIKRKKLIRLHLLEAYGEDQEPRETQIPSIEGLLDDALQGVFTVASTGSGKSRIGESLTLFFDGKTVTVIIGPLDELAWDQVREKIANGFTACAITKKSWTKDLQERVLAGEFQFVYIVSQTLGLESKGAELSMSNLHSNTFSPLKSPEKFNKDPVWAEMCANPVFQALVILIVLDEAQKIWEWGLIKNQKKYNIYVKKNDNGAFRPEYDNLAARRMQLKCKVLLLSGGVTPPEISAICTTVGISESKTCIVRGDLFRPNLRNCVAEMASTQKSWGDITSLFNLRPPTSLPPPTIVYSNSRSGTGVANVAMHRAAGVDVSADSTISRRYHSNTSDYDKSKSISDFLLHLFMVLIATSAIGLGINWGWLRMVVQFGRCSVADDGQRKGRAGRNGEEAIGLTFIESRSKRTLKARAEAREKRSNEEYTPEDASDDFYSTRVCLDVANILYFRNARVPMNPKARDVKTELARQLSIRKRACLCSNCDPDGTSYIVDHLHLISSANFNHYALYNGRPVVPDDASSDAEDGMVTRARRAGRAGGDESEEEEEAGDEEIGIEGDEQEQGGEEGAAAFEAAMREGEDDVGPRAFTPTAAQRRSLEGKLTKTIDAWWIAKFGPPDVASILQSDYILPLTIGQIKRAAGSITSLPTLLSVPRLQLEPYEGLWSVVLELLDGWRGAGMVEQLKADGERAQRQAQKAVKEAAKAEKEAIENRTAGEKIAEGKRKRKELDERVEREEELHRQRRREEKSRIAAAPAAENTGRGARHKFVSEKAASSQRRVLGEKNV
ncbi:hypothetical protein P7C70_g6124, partial [Phenoliferia sp. Uapishka_3]